MTVVSIIFGGLFLMSQKVAHLPFYQREAEGLIVKAHYYPISAIVLAVVAFTEIVYLQVKFSGLGVWVVSFVIGVIGLYFLYTGVSWLIAEHKDEQWRKTLQAEEDERISKLDRS